MKKTYKRMQSGGMLLEMIAVLGLVAVSAPAIYKKNIERTEEIRDMTKASQLRVLKDAAAQYVEKQYDAIIRDSAASHWTNKKIEPAALAHYLPEGYKVDDDIQIYLTAKHHETDGNRPQGLLSAIVLDNEEVTEARGNRIARMVGVEGGYTMDNKVYGNHGAWSLTSADLGGDIPENRVAVSSTYSKNLSSSDYIYRNKVEGYPEANMMFTDIDMNGSSIDHIGRLAMRYNNGDKWADPQIGGYDEGSTGNSADATRDKGLSLLVHGERGEIVGKTRSDAKKKDYNWWNKVKDRDAEGEIDLAAAVADTSHFDSDDSDNKTKATLELSVGGPAKPEYERDGYLRLRADDSNACTRIESNYRMPDRNLTATGLTGGGAFIACSNDPDHVDTAVRDTGTGADTLGGKLGMPTASLVADDLSVADDAAVAGKAGGSGYMIVTNPNNKRKAVIYGNYATSFFNTDEIRKEYSGAAMEAVNKNDKIAALSAASLSGGKKGAKNGVSHTEEGTVTNLYDANGNVKTQFRADERGGFIYAYGDNSQDYPDLPTVAVKGSQDIDGVEPNESYALVTRRQNKGYAIMQSNYKEYDDDVATGAFMIKDERTNKEVAVMGNKKAGDDSNAGGYFALKDGDSQDRFRALGTENGGAVYMGNSSNDSRLDKPADDSNVNRTVMIETYHNGATSPSGGYMKLSNIRKSSLEVASNNADADDEQGGGMFASKDNGVLTAKIHSSTVGKLGDDGIGETAGGGVALRDGEGNARKAELVTSSNVDTGSVQGGTFALKNSGSRNVLVTARGPNNGGWMEVSNGGSKAVDFYANYGKGGQIDVAGGSAVSMISGSSLMTVGSGTKVYGNIGDAGYGTGGGLTVGSTALSAKRGTAGALVIGGSQGAFGDNGTLDAGGVKIAGGSLTAGDIRSSARIKVGGNLNLGSNSSLSSLIFSAGGYNDIDGAGTIGYLFKKAMADHIGVYARTQTQIGHTSCWSSDEDDAERARGNCPQFLYKTVSDGEGGYVKVKMLASEAPSAPSYGRYALNPHDPYGNKDRKYYSWGRFGALHHGDGNNYGASQPENDGIAQGRLHDYALYAGMSSDKKTHEAIIRHVHMYDLNAEPESWYDVNGNDISRYFGAASFQKHDVPEKWHDNIDMYAGTPVPSSVPRRMDTGSWSRSWPTESGADTSGSRLPDAVSRKFNRENGNY